MTEHSSLSPVNLIKRFTKNSTYYSGTIFHKHDYPTGLFYGIKFRVVRFFDDLRMFFMRGKNGYTRVDVYNINTWFAETIIHLLDDMINHLHGYPCMRDEIKDDADWTKILSRMRDCFRTWLLYECCEDDSITEEEAYSCVEEGLSLFKKYFLDLWD